MQSKSLQFYFPETEKYFSYYPKEVREKVKFIVIDMYNPYILLIQEYFPNAIIIIDRVCAVMRTQ